MNFPAENSNNPIEFVFSKLKHAVRNMRLQDMMNNRKRTFEELVPIAVNQLTLSDVNNCIEHVYKLYGIL